MNRFIANFICDIEDFSFDSFRQSKLYESTLKMQKYSKPAHTSFLLV